MSTAAIVISGLAAAYCLLVALYCWVKSGSDRLAAVQRSEHREPESVAAVSAFARLNPAYRFRRYSDDERLVTRNFPGSHSALADESR